MRLTHILLPQTDDGNPLGRRITASEHVATYLQNHHAGSVLAVELLEHLNQAHACMIVHIQPRGA